MGKRVALLRREHVLAILHCPPPFATRNWRRALRPLLDFAVLIKWAAENPTKDMKAKIRGRAKVFAPGEEQITAFRQHYAFGTRARLALELLVNTTQRRGDVDGMDPSISATTCCTCARMQKTGEPLRLPIFPSC